MEGRPPWRLVARRDGARPSRLASRWRRVLSFRPMKRWIGALAGVAMCLAPLLAQEEELPKPDESGLPLEIEPPLLIPLRAPDGSIPDLPGMKSEPQSADIAKLETDLARAKKRAASGDGLFRAGIIAKVDAEQRLLKAVQMEASLAAARLAEAKTKAETEDNGEARLLLADAEKTAQRAAEERERAEMEAALRNLQRQQKLLALGSGRKADVNRAEKKLAELQRPLQQP